MARCQGSYLPRVAMHGFHPALRRAALRHIRFHDLRRTFAAFLIAQDVHPKRIQALMGHSNLEAHGLGDKPAANDPKHTFGAS